MKDRKVGIIGGGPTDRKIFGKIVQCLLLQDASETGVKVIELKRQNIRDFVDRYWKEASKTDDYFLPGKPATTLLNQITSTLLGAFSDFEGEVGVGEISGQDVLLITTDSERLLNSPENYFDVWAFSLSKIFIGAVEKFYHSKVIQGYQSSYIPITIPIVAFPSTEVFVVAAKNVPSHHYGKTARELKQVLYGTTHFSEEDLEEKALNFITSDTVDRIFHQLPESRLFIRYLSFGKLHIA